MIQVGVEKGIISKFECSICRMSGAILEGGGFLSPGHQSLVYQKNLANVRSTVLLSRLSKLRRNAR